MPSQSSVTTPERTTGILRNGKHLWGQKGKAENYPVQNGGLGMVCGLGNRPGGTDRTGGDELERLF